MTMRIQIPLVVEMTDEQVSRALYILTDGRSSRKIGASRPRKRPRKQPRRKL